MGDPALGANVKWALVAKGVGVGTKLCAVVVLTRVLGPEQFGVFVWVLSTTALLTVFADFGVSASVAKLLSESPGSPRAALRVGGRMVCGAFVAVASVLVVFAGPLGELAGAPWLVALPWYVAGMLAVQVWRRFANKAFEGLARQSVYGKVTLRVGWLPWAGGIVGTVVGGDVQGALGGYVVGGVVVGAAMTTALLGLAGLAGLDERQGAGAGGAGAPPFRTIARYALPLVATAASFYVFTSSDILLLQALAGSAVVGTYGVAVRVVETLHTPSGAIGSGLAVFIARGRADGSGREILTRASRVLLALYLPGAVVLGALAAPGIEAVFGADYAPAVVVLYWYLPYLVVKSLASTYALALDYAGMAGARARAVAGAAVLNVGLNLWLIPRYGAEGAAISTLVTYVPLVGWYGWALLRACGGAGADAREALALPAKLAAAAAGLMAATTALTDALLPLASVAAVGVGALLWRSGVLQDARQISAIRLSRRPASAPERPLVRA